MLLKIKKIEGFEDLETPGYATRGSVGMDLYAALDSEVTIMPGEIKLISTGICIEIPKGYEAQIRPRSGLALKYGITMLNSPGTIDWDYRGEIKAIIINHGNEVFTIKRGDRIAQMIINKVETPIIEVVSQITPTERNTNGFGSTGI